MSLFLFPGQGSQRPGMGADLFERSPAARAVFDEAAPLLPDGFFDTVFSGAQDRLNDTRIAQPALLAVEVAISRHLEARGVRPAGSAGHSLGEIPALAVAGTLRFADALGLVLERARAMSENVPEGGMAAVMGLDADAIEAALPEGASVANYNGPAQTIITGTKAALAAAAALLKEAGAKRVVPLRVSGPFHSPLMRPAVERLRAVLDGMPLEPPRIRFISSVSGQEEDDPERIRTLLAEQVASPVRWTDVMRRARTGPVIEIGPGGVLKGLAKRIDGAPEVLPAGTLEEVDALAEHRPA